MPAVDLRLEPVSPGEQLRVARTQPPDQRCKSRPETAGLDAGAGHGFAIDEIMETSIDFQPFDQDGPGLCEMVRHGALLDLRP
jgi:hypothetical protein